MMSKALLKCVRCQSCRNEAVWSLIGLAGGTAPRSVRAGQNLLPRQRKAFSQLPGDNGNEGALPKAVEYDIESGSAAGNLEKRAAQHSPSSPSSDPHVPWYLQDEMQEALPQSPKKRQLLPQLPDHPPPILDNVLQYLSDTLGVDDLALFDLRDIDPPSALGANLIMIIGTTRSFKHLNSSSDRFCRWLRKEFKLRPDADGLLGRQELKLKLRRKARKAKLASSVGATIEDVDDGIVTRWICVNAGAIEDGRPASAIPRVPGFVGFGTQSPTCQLVVQLMTEDKRAELDLETLWGGLLTKRAPTPLAERGTARSELNIKPEHESIASRVTYTNQQTRSFLTSARSSSGNSEKYTDPSSLMKSAKLPITTLPYGKPGLYSNWKDPIVEPPYQTPLIQNISAHSRPDIIAALGKGPMDRDSTEFLRRFYDKISQFEFSYREAFKLELIRLAVKSGHPNYTKQDLYRAYQDLCFSGYDIPKAHAVKIVSTLLSHHTPPHNTSQSRAQLRLPEEELNLALKCIAHMSLQGQDVFHASILARLHRATMFKAPVYLAPKRQVPSSIPAERAYPVSQEECRTVFGRQSRIRKIMKLSFTEFNAEEFPKLLKLHLYQGQYDLFWDIWRRSAILGIPRTKEVYLRVFELMAERANERLIWDMIWEIVPMMSREAIPVNLDKDLAKALMTCLAVVDPKIRNSLDDAGYSKSRGPLYRLWNKCMKVILKEISEPSP